MPPETRASLAFVSQWDPDLFMDLHTTDGSYHGYDLTWSPGLNPNHTPTNDWVQDTVLEQVRNPVRTREGTSKTYRTATSRGATAPPARRPGGAPTNRCRATAPTSPA